MRTNSFPIKVIVFVCCIFLFASFKSAAASIEINEREAVVWLERQTISGRLKGFFAKQLTVQCNRSLFRIAVKDDSTFSFIAILRKGENKIKISTVSRAAKIVSDTLRLTLGFTPTPVILPYASYKNGRLTLHAELVNNPWNRKLNFLWSADKNNPSICRIENKNDSITAVQLPSVNGIYYFNLAIFGLKDTAHFQTYVIKNDSSVHVFNLKNEHAPWIDTAVVYEITPSNFVQGGSYDAIANKLGELKTLGVNTIWLQPVYRTFRKGQGYDVTNYFSLREDLGTESQLKALISKAKALGMHVLFDFVPNHTSIQHPYAQDCIQYGTASHYYNFYQHEKDSVAYSQYYKKNENGFVTYFWDDLVNLNYNSEEVQRWIIEACKHWVQKLGIDGYRFDAVWGLNARAPNFFKRLRLELKSIKPDLLLLAEDKGSLSSPYEAGFDAAYDWTAEMSWVSHWSWQYEYDERKNLTVFNHPAVYNRVSLLKKALFQNGNQSNLRLRFTENNDLPRFVNNHPIAATRLAAALAFSLPGIPLVYNGQETGSKHHPYSKHGIFDSTTSIQSQDSAHLFSYFQKLIRLRQNHSALQSRNIAEVLMQPDNKMLAFQRWQGGERFLVVLNLDSVNSTARFNARTVFNDAKKEIRVLEDVLSDAVFYTKEENETELPMEGYGIRWLLLK